MKITLSLEDLCLDDLVLSEYLSLQGDKEHIVLKKVGLFALQ